MENHKNTAMSTNFNYELRGKHLTSISADQIEAGFDCRVLNGALTKRTALTYTKFGMEIKKWASKMRFNSVLIKNDGIQ